MYSENIYLLFFYLDTKCLKTRYENVYKTLITMCGTVIKALINLLFSYYYSYNNILKSIIKDIICIVKVLTKSSELMGIMIEYI